MFNYLRIVIAHRLYSDYSFSKNFDSRKFSGIKSETYMMRLIRD